MPQTPQLDHPPQPKPLQTNVNGTKIRVTESQLDKILSTASSNAALHALLARELPKNTRVIHPSDYPEAPIDEDLVRRVQSLQSTVESLSKLVAKRREEAVAKLQEQVSAAHADVSNIRPPSPRPLPERRVYPPALPVAAVLGKAAARAKDTRKRANRVRQVLRMLCENAQDRDDVSCTIAADWSDTFEDLGKALSRDDAEEVSTISPFVTPRSKTRKRIARFAGQMRRLELPR